MTRIRLFLVLLVAAVTWPLTNAGFAYDDLIIIQGNPTIDSLGPRAVARIFAQNYWYPHLTNDNLYRPVTILTHAVEHAVAGESPLLYHLVNIALHAVNVLLLFSLLVKLNGPGKWNCVFAASVFAVHPAFSEAICNVTCRADILVVTFVLTAANLIVQDEHGRRSIWWVPLLALLAMFSKENGLLLLPVVILIDAFRQIQRGQVNTFIGMLQAFRNRWSMYSVAIATVVGGWLIRASVMGRMTPSVLITPPELNILAHEPALVRMMTAVKVYGLAAEKFLCPPPLSFDYGTMTITPVNAPWDPQFLVPLIILSSAIGWSIWRGYRAPCAAVGILLFVGCFLPVSNLLFPITTIFNERLLYLPALGVGFLLASIPLPAVPRAAVIATGTLVVASLATVFVLRAHDWESHEKIVESSVAASPRSANALLDLAKIRQEDGDLARMQQLIERAVAAFPESPRANFSLGQLYMKQGVPELAISRFEVALTERPTQTSLMSAMRLGLIHAQSGADSLAIGYYHRALAINPYEPGAHHNLALLYRGRNDALFEKHARIAANLGRPIEGR